MKARVVALLGLSGVGKSTMLTRIVGKTAFRHLQASQLIKDELARISALHASSEELRTGAVSCNQQLLVSAFKREAATDTGCIVIDGHSVIDTPNGLLTIPPETFARIGVAYVVVLQDATIRIAERRLADTSRVRPQRSLQQLTEHQARSLEAAAEIGLHLKCPVTVLTPDNDAELISVLAR
jgi:adenylate kinase